MQLLPAHRQFRLIGWLTRQRPGRRPARPGALIRVRDAGHALRARVVTDMTPAAAWRHNLDTVTAALDDAGIDYFCLRTLDHEHSAVAVNRADRERTLAALRPAGVRIRVGRFDRNAFQPDRRRLDGIQVFVPFTDPRGGTVFGSGSACEVEFWDTAPGMIVAPRRNRFADALPQEAVTVRVSAATLSPRVSPADNEPCYRSRSEFAEAYPDDVQFPIDVVYTWVDGSDPEWLERKNAALAALGHGQINQDATSQSRFLSRNELKYSLRSIAGFAPWVRHVYLVTDDQLPAWLDASCPRLTVVPHRELFGGTGALPTFNSHAIESRLHRIPGLAEHFLYFNDDMFLGRPVPPTAFFHANGIAKFFPSPAQLDAGPATVHDTPVSAAGKNNRRHVEERFDRCIAQKMMHVPYPLQRSVLEEIEGELPDEVRQTAAHPFRHPRDLSIPSSLAHYWAYHTRRAVPGTLRYAYADLAAPETPVKLAHLLARRQCDVFCLNDTDSAVVAPDEQAALLAEFLPRYFPFRSPFELPEEVAVRRAAYSATALGRSALRVVAAPARTSPP